MDILSSLLYLSEKNSDQVCHGASGMCVCMCVCLRVCVLYTHSEHSVVLVHALHYSHALISSLLFIDSNFSCTAHSASYPSVVDTSLLL